MADSHLNTVRKKLQAYAERGVFRGFVEMPRGGSKTEFQFIWLENHRFVLLVDHDKGTLQLKDVLPAVESRSYLDTDLRDFVNKRTDQALPAHRRVDPKRAELKYVNRKSKATLTLHVLKNQYSYGVTKLLNTTNELFGFLHMRHPPYLWENFGVPEE